MVAICHALATPVLIGYEGGSSNAKQERYNRLYDIENAYHAAVQDDGTEIAVEIGDGLICTMRAWKIEA